MNLKIYLLEKVNVVQVDLIQCQWTKLPNHHREIERLQLKRIRNSLKLQKFPQQGKSPKQKLKQISRFNFEKGNQLEQLLKEITLTKNTEDLDTTKVNVEMLKCGKKS